MEVEPYQDTIPPRHQIESDESDEDTYPAARVQRKIQHLDPKVVVEWKGPQEKRRSLLLALDKPGWEWAAGLELGEIKGSVFIDDIEVASAYSPSWADVTVVRTELRLPLYAIHPFSSTIISALQPTKVVIIDAYALPSYISSSPPTFHPPIRFLRTTAATEDKKLPGAELFAPPNLIQSPAASFLSILEPQTSATLLLLPSAHIPSPAPPDLKRRAGPDLQEEWENTTLANLHKLVGIIIGQDSSWTANRIAERSSRIKASRRGDIGEGSMYI